MDGWDTRHRPSAKTVSQSTVSAKNTCTQPRENHHVHLWAFIFVSLNTHGTLSATISFCRHVLIAVVHVGCACFAPSSNISRAILPNECAWHSLIWNHLASTWRMCCPQPWVMAARRTPVPFSPHWCDNREVAAPSMLTVNS